MMRTNPDTLPDGYRMTELGSLPEGWQVLKVSDAIRRTIRVPKVPQSEYRETGTVPVIDQGQSYIAGYVNDIEPFQPPVPVIVFGDHTRVVKYVDFAFVVGADGTKVLLPDTNKVDPLFLYFALGALKLPNRGYNRHFTLLREQFIPLPPLAEQRAIAHVLRTVQAAKEAGERVVEALRALKKSLMRHLFTYGPVPIDNVGAQRAVPLRETELGPLPAHWQVVRLGDVSETKSGGTPDRTRVEFFGGSIPWVKSGELNDSVIVHTEETLTEEGVKSSNAKIFPKGTLLVAMYGATAGKVGILDIDAATNQAVCGIFPDPGVLLNGYLFYALIYRRSELLRARYGGAQPNISQTVLKNFLIPLPPLDEQREIARILQAVDRRIQAEEAHVRALEDLFRTLLQELMTGRRRVPVDIPGAQQHCVPMGQDASS